MTRMPPVVVVGDLLTDVLVRAGAPRTHASDAPAVASVHGGGSGGNVAAWLATLGVPVTFVGRVGTDPYGTAAEDGLVRAGVRTEVARDPDAPTGTCVVLVHADGERDFLVDPGASANLSPSDLPVGCFGPGRHLHLSGYPVLHAGSRAAAVAAVERARTAGMTVSVDPASAAPLVELGAARFLDLIGPVDLLLPNAEEAAVLTGAPDPATAAAMLSGHAREVVITLGAGGALWSAAGSPTVRMPADPVDATAETTGAGDAFAAGWLHSRLGGARPTEALRAACALAAEVVARPGARPGGP
jgi:ribokinase